IPWAIDAPTLLERVFNRARWPGAVAAEASALALEIALAHEATSHALADASGAGLADVLRDAPITVVTGAAASFSRAAHTALVAVAGTPLKARGTAGELGIIVDARGRPLALPPRDAERIPTVVRWFAALDLPVASTA